MMPGQLRLGGGMGGNAGSAQRRELAHEPQAPLLCEKTFAGFCKSVTAKDIQEAVLLRLVEGDVRLLRIASARARRDSAAMAQEADGLASIADALGLCQTADLARQLEAACLSEEQVSTYRMIGQLGEIFQNSGSALEALLQRGSVAKS
jgi:hypothetical protein